MTIAKKLLFGLPALALICAFATAQPASAAPYRTTSVGIDGTKTISDYGTTNYRHHHYRHHRHHHHGGIVVHL
jgi:hypothetical protein